MLWFVLVFQIDQVFFGPGDVGFGFCNDTVLVNFTLGGQVGSADGFMNVNVNVRFVDDFSVPVSARSRLWGRMKINILANQLLNNILKGDYSDGARILTWSL